MLVALASALFNFAAMPCWFEPGALLGDDKNQRTEKNDARPKPKIIISKETTYITEPLRDDGYPDYVAALNAKLSKGVTPENNAAVLLLRAVGPGEIEEQHRAEFFKRLGIDPLPEQGEYFVRFDEFIKTLPNDAAAAKATDADDEPLSREDRLRDQLQKCMAAPWKRADCPEIAAWLDKNDKPLKTIVETTKRERCYLPLYAPLNELAPLIGVQASREAAKAITCRAMLQLNDNRIAEAWGDIHATFKLARLIGQGSSIVDYLVSGLIDNFASKSFVALLGDSSLTEAQFLAVTRDYRTLPAPKQLSETFDLGERAFGLEVVGFVANRGVRSMATLTDNDLPLPRNAIDWAADLIIDWNTCARTVNEFFDRLVTISKTPDVVERDELYRALDSELKQISARFRKPPPVQDVFLSLRKICSEKLSIAFVAIIGSGYPAVNRAERIYQTQRLLNDVLLALRGYKFEHSKYPATLDQLVPKYLPAIPTDAFAARPFVYKPTADGQGFLLYSLGANGKDDGGRTFDDRHANVNDTDVAKAFDDITVRVPVAMPNVKLPSAK